MDAVVGVAELHELNVLVLCEFQLIARFGHLFSLVNFGQLDTIQVVGHAQTLYVAISHKYLDFIQVIVGRLHEEQLIIE